MFEGQVNEPIVNAPYRRPIMSFSRLEGKSPRVHSNLATKNPSRIEFMLHFAQLIRWFQTDRGIALNHISNFTARCFTELFPTGVLHYVL
jgi:hypothetical protein